MMAFDRTPTTPDLDPLTIAALRTTLQKSVDRGSHDEDLRDVLCRAADEARRKGILAERLLVMLKDIWYSLPPIAGASSTDTSHALLQELVSRCIHEYYSL
jgi:hypothetical protein